MHLIGSQLAFHWQSIEIKFSFRVALHWFSSCTQMSVNWLIIIGLVNSKFGQQKNSDFNRGFSLVESSEYWLLIGREAPQKIFKEGTLMILNLCQLSVFDLNWD